MITDSDKARFWSKVDKTEDCWIWTANKNKWGYGRLRMGKRGLDYRNELAHRLSWKISYGYIPPGLCVLHRCDNPPCIRPDHLFLGTHLDNARDRISKGRGFIKGSQFINPRRCGQKLNPEGVRAIRLLLAAGQTHKEIARKTGVSDCLVSKIRNRKIWSHVV